MTALFRSHRRLVATLLPCLVLVAALGVWAFRVPGGGLAERALAPLGAGDSGSAASGVTGQADDAARGAGRTTGPGQGAKGTMGGGDGAAGPLRLHADKGRIADAAGREVVVSGVNWFGLETGTFAPHGLWTRNWREMLDQVVALGFNALRLPYSNQLLDAGSKPNGIDFAKNPDLQGLSGLEIMDKIVRGAAERGLMVILDRHRPDAGGQSALWYTDKCSEERWIHDWVMLAQRYAEVPAIIGADLHNEPHGEATWGSGDPRTDWRLAAERAGNAILDVCPHWLIFVEGIESYRDDYYWWGGQLAGAADYPVRLKLPDRLVYSPHDYGPGVHGQRWFSAPGFPANMPDLWDAHWGYLAKQGVAPILVGEFGGRSMGADTEGTWQRALFAYLQANRLSYTYWSLNPNSGDTGGILNDDWQTVNAAKMAVISRYQTPLQREAAQLWLGSLPEPSPPPPAQPTPGRPAASPTALSSGVAAGNLQVLYRSGRNAGITKELAPEFQIRNAGSQPVPLAALELRYYFSVEEPGAGTQILDVDWSSHGAGNVLGAFTADPADPRSLCATYRFMGGGALAAGEVLELKSRVHMSDWSEYRQDGDYSYWPLETYTLWPRVTLLVDGSPVWGQEPSTSWRGA